MQQTVKVFGSPNGHQNGHQIGVRRELNVTGGNSPVALLRFGIGFSYLRDCVKTMKTRYRLTCRGSRGGKFYCVDTQTGKRTSLQTGNEEEARQLVEAKNQAQRQPVLNLQIAKAYLAAADSNLTISILPHRQFIVHATNRRSNLSQSQLLPFLTKNTGTWNFETIDSILPTAYTISSYRVSKLLNNTKSSPDA